MSGPGSWSMLAARLLLAAGVVLALLVGLEAALRAFGAFLPGTYGAGDRAEALDACLRGTCGPDYRPALQHALPSAFDQALAETRTFFGR